MSKEIIQLKQTYEMTQKELSSKQSLINTLQQEKYKLTNDQNNLSALQKLDQQIQYLQQEISRITPVLLSLESQHQNLLSTNNNLDNTNQSLEQQIITSKQKKAEYDELFNDIDSVLNNLSGFTGQVIDTTQMIVKNIPKPELKNSKALLEICKKKSKDSFEELIKKLDDINAVDSNGMTLLMYSLKHGFWYGVDRLLEMPIEVNTVDNNGFNALMYACTMPRMKYVMQLIEQTEDINIKSVAGNTALFSLCANLNYLYSSEKSNELKEYNVSGSSIKLDSDLVVSSTEGMSGINLGGISVSTSSEDAGLILSLSHSGGETYSVIISSQKLQLRGSAIEYKILTLVDKFLSHGANINTQCVQGLTSLFIACAVKNEYLVKSLISRKACLTQQDDNKHDGFMWLSEIKDTTTMQKMLAQGVNIDRQDKNGLTLLFWMVQYGWQDMVDFLIQNKANPNIANNAGEYPMHVALTKNHFDIFNKLAIHPAINIKSTDVNGLSILHYGTHLGRADIIKLAVNKGVDINLGDALGRTSVYWCSILGNLEMLQCLQQHGADINIPIKSGYHPIHGAVHNGHIAIIDKLLAAGVSINQLSTDKVSPLYYSLGYGGQDINIDLVKFLLNKGADVTIAMNDGDTPMHMAHYCANKDIINLLLEKSASLNIQNDDHKTPLHCMIEKTTLAKELKIEILKAFKDQYDFSIIDKDSKTPVDYIKQYCADAIEIMGDLNTNFDQLQLE